jgi:cell division protein FtsL
MSLQNRSFNSPSSVPQGSDENDSEAASAHDSFPLVGSNPPLRIMAGRQRRIKGEKNQRRRKIRSSNHKERMASMGELKGILAVLLVVALVVVVEVIFVDQLFLGAGGRISNMELHISTANVYVADIVEAGLNRYRPGKEIVKFIHLRDRLIPGMKNTREEKGAFARQADAETD